MMKLKAIWFAVLSITVFFPGMPSRAENPIKASPDRFSIAVECVKRFEGWHGEKKHWPYVGWGHKVLPGERFTNSITKAQGDSILRADLRKLCRMFSYLGRDSLIVSVLAYNVGCSRIKGYGKIPKSRLLKKLESGDRDIYKEYVSFRCYKGKVVPSIERRRKVEYMLLFEKKKKKGESFSCFRLSGSPLCVLSESGHLCGLYVSLPERHPVLQLLPADGKAVVPPLLRFVESVPGSPFFRACISLWLYCIAPKR